MLARILFLSTAFSASYIVTFVDGKYNGRTVVEIIGMKLDLLLIHVQNSTRMAKEAMTDVLKFTYNITHHYPKVRLSILISTRSHIFRRLYKKILRVMLPSKTKERC